MGSFWRSLFRLWVSLIWWYSIHNIAGKRSVSEKCMVRLSVKKMLNSSYIYIVLICFVLAVPVGYYGINKWLESFAYKTPMFWWVYPLALLIVLTITVGTVTYQSWQAANANPVDSLKSE